MTTTDAPSDGTLNSILHRAELALAIEEQGRCPLSDKALDPTSAVLVVYPDGVGAVIHGDAWDTWRDMTMDAYPDTRVIDGRALFEDRAACADYEARDAGVVGTYEDGARSRPVGASDPRDAQGRRYIQHVVTEHALPATVTAVETDRHLYVPIVRIGDTHVVSVTDDGPGRYLCVHRTLAQCDVLDDDIRHAHGLTGSQMLDFLRQAIADSDNTTRQ